MLLHLLFSCGADAPAPLVVILLLPWIDFVFPLLLVLARASPFCFRSQTIEAHAVLCMRFSGRTGYHPLHHCDYVRTVFHDPRSVCAALRAAHQVLSEHVACVGVGVVVFARAGCVGCLLARFVRRRLCDRFGQYFEQLERVQRDPMLFDFEWSVVSSPPQGFFGQASDGACQRVGIEARFGRLVPSHVILQRAVSSPEVVCVSAPAVDIPVFWRVDGVSSCCLLGGAALQRD